MSYLPPRFRLGDGDSALKVTLPWWWTAWVIFTVVGSILMASAVVYVAWHFISKFW